MVLATTKPLSDPISSLQDKPETFPDLTEADLGTTLTRCTSEALNSDSYSTLPTAGWAIDSLIADTEPTEIKQ